MIEARTAIHKLKIFFFIPVPFSENLIHVIIYYFIENDKKN